MSPPLFFLYYNLSPIVLLLGRSSLLTGVKKITLIFPVGYDFAYQGSRRILLKEADLFYGQDNLLRTGDDSKKRGNLLEKRFPREYDKEC